MRFRSSVVFTRPQLAESSGRTKALTFRARLFMVGVTATAALPGMLGPAGGSSTATGGMPRPHSAASAPAARLASAPVLPPAVNLSGPTEVANPTGQSPQHVITADLNGDGKRDLVFDDASTVRIELGNGDGTFTDKVHYTLGNAGGRLLATDLNGDGKPDLIVGQASAGVAVFLGNGDGTFQTPVDYTAVPTGLAAGAVDGIGVADLNGDGKLDIVTGDGDKQTYYSVLLGNGDGTFQTFTAYGPLSTENGGGGVALADFNRDGRMDLALTSRADFGAGPVGVFVAMGNGDGTFGSATFYRTGNTYANAEDVNAADINSDGINDLVVSPTNCTDGTTVFVGAGDGSFTLSQTLTNACVDGQTLADINGDGIPDLITTEGISPDYNYQGDHSTWAEVYLGVGDGTFQFAGKFATAPGTQAMVVASGDLNGDGIPDVITANVYSDDLSVFLNTSVQGPYGGPIKPSELPGGICAACLAATQGQTGQPVDTGSGDFWHVFSDLTIPGRGLPLAFTHTYNAVDAGANGPLGYGWTFSYDMYLSIAATTVTVNEGTGGHETFTLEGGSYTAPPRVMVSLVKNGDGTYSLATRTGTTYTFSASGQLVSERDRNGYVTSLSYNSSNQLTTVTDPASRTLSIGWSGSNITSVTDANVTPSRSVSFAYNDGNGNLTDYYDVRGQHWKFAYDSSHRLTNMWDPNCLAAGSACNTGNGLVNAYDPQNRVTSQTDDMGRTTQFVYAGNEEISGTTTITDPMNNVTVDTYYYGERVSVTRGSGSATPSTWVYAYDPATAALTKVTDPNDNATTYTVDSNGNVLSSTDPLGRLTSATYNSFNEPLTQTDGNRVTTTNAYDAAGNFLSTSRPLSGTGQVQVTTYRYQDPAHPGDVTSMVDPNANVWNSVYDRYGDRIQAIDPLGHVTTSTDDADGNLLTSTTPKGAAPAPVQLSASAIAGTTGWSAWLRSDGTVWASGYNADGELGNGTTTTPSGTPGEVCAAGQTTPCGQYLSGVVSVSAGGQHGLAAKTDGTVWAWGSNAQGQLGTGNTTNSLVPVQTTGLSGLTVTAVVAGNQNSLALTSTGDVYAWGLNNTGDLGDGTTTNRTSPVHVCAPGQTAPCSSFLTGITALATHKGFVIALKSDGTVYAWGVGTDGEQGNGLTAQNKVPVQVCAPGQTAPCSQFLTGVTAVAAGDTWAMALKSDGTVDAWGANDRGQLGNGTSDTGTAHPIPAQVGGLSSVSGIAAGWSQGLALLNDGTLRSWGYNNDGQLGIGSATTTGCQCQPTVQQMTGIWHVKSIAGGNLSSLATTVDGATWSWGGDVNGELGNGSTGSTPTLTPTAMTGITGSVNTAFQNRYTYDQARRPLTATDALGHTTQKHYDPNGNVDWTQDANQYGQTCVLPPPSGANPCTVKAYDLDNEPTVTTRADGTTAKTDYNADGTVHDQVDGKGNAIATYGYDSQARVTSFTDDTTNHNVTAYAYDAAGNLVSKADPGGSCTTVPATSCTSYSHDLDNELTGVSYSDGTTPNVTNILYDGDGQRTAMTDGTGTSSWSWDSLHRLTSYTNGAGATVGYGYTYSGGTAYDLTGQVRSIIYPNGVGTVTQTWDAASRLTAAQDWNGKTTTFSYDANANLTQMTVPSTTAVSDSFGFDNADQMVSVSVSNGSTLFSAAYSRDSAGQLTSDSSQAAGQQAYKYTGLNQLCYAGSASSSGCASPPTNSYPYAYDQADNLTTIENAAHTGTNAQQFNAADELCWTVPGASGNGCGTAPSGATTFVYNARGDRTATVPPTGSATCETYNLANEQKTVKTGTGNSCTTPTTVATYAYDGDGLRESKTVGATTTRFTWEGAGGVPLLLQQAAGSTITSYVYGPDGLPFEQVSGSTTTYLHHDQLGSTRLITDAAGSTATATTMSFDPYGNVVSSSGGLTTSLAFAGQYLDSETGLYYLRARYYDPSTAQFLTVDPLVSKTMAPYAYAAGDPLTFTDPSGMDNDYYYSWDMGPARSGGPQATLWWLTHRADYEFPFTIHNLASSYTVHSFGAISDVGDTTSTLCAGNNYAISAGGGSQPIHVDYAGMQGNVAVLEFTALPGHVEGTGSTIRFSSWVSADGHQHFDVTGHDTYNYDGVPASWPLGFFAGSFTHVVDHFAIQSMWNQLATNVNGGSYPGG